MVKPKLDKKIVIVGNGTSLLDKEVGFSIDACDVVLRFNDFKIKGYEKHVGTRTDIWWGYNEPHPELATFKQVYFPWIGPDNLWPLYRKISVMSRKVNVPCEFIDKNTIAHAYKLIGTVPNGVPKPTTGFVALLWAKKRYTQVCFAGIDHFEKGYHYYDKKSPPAVHIIHKIKREKALIQEWVNPIGIKKL